MKIEGTNATEQSRTYGRHFDHNDQLVSKISRESINALKSHFQDDMNKDDWRLVGGGGGVLVFWCWGSGALLCGAGCCVGALRTVVGARAFF